MTAKLPLPLVDTDRAELRALIADARERFDALARGADPLARLPRSEWNVSQGVAHVLSVARRYETVTAGRMFRSADKPRDLDAINAEDLAAVLGPLDEMLDRIKALAPVMDEWFDRVDDLPDPFPFHGGIRLSGTAAQTNWLGELLLHGADIAKASGAKWELPPRAMTLVCRGVLEFGAAYVRADTDPKVDMLVEMRMPGARPYVARIKDGKGEIRDRRDGDRPDAVLRGSAAVFADLLYQRVGPFGATLRGLLVVGGRRPWVSLSLLNHFEPP